MSKNLLGIDLGGTSVKFGILTECGEVINKWSIDTRIEDNGKYIVPDIIESIKNTLDSINLKIEDFKGIGMGSPGTINREKGTVVGAYNLNWGELQEIKATFEKELKVPFYIDNDANVAALGEKWIGAGEDRPDVVFITLGTGVGGGIIAEGKLIHGAIGAAGEIGHIIVEPETGFECTCGNHGCLETVASATGIVRLAKHLSKVYTEDSKLHSIINEGTEITAKDIFDFAKQGDKFAIVVVERVSYYLGLASANIANILNPTDIVIGGGVSAAGDFLIEKVEKYFNKHAFPQVRKSTKIKLAILGNDAGIIGAAYIAKEKN
ncbi:ROK family glucokinase [Clostridium intestinale]|uniref:ROK family glucokinase n=1 Tax=Clostridium intestinale TaxID=36845 RepID=UPI0028E69786|nr:ROK family glucokinase [Clostridium intestinale]